MNIVDDASSSNRFFVTQSNKILFAGAPKRKLLDTRVKKELKACTEYGSLNASQVILNRYAKNEYKSMDEMVGDLQLILVDSYKKLKVGLNLKTRDYGIETLLEDCARISNEKETV